MISIEDKKRIELDHPCKDTCSGWQQGFEKGLERAQEREKILILALEKIDYLMEDSYISPIAREALARHRENRGADE